MSELFICTVCGIEYEPELGEEVTEAERTELWAPEIAAGAQPEEFAPVCHDCFTKFMQWLTSESDIVRPAGAPPEEKT